MRKVRHRVNGYARQKASRIALLSQAARGCSIIPRIKALDRISDDTKASLSLEASIVPSSKSAMQLGLGIAAFEAAVNTPWRKMKKIASETKV